MKVNPKGVALLTTIFYGTFVPPECPSRRHIMGAIDEPIIKKTDFAATRLADNVMLYLSQYAGLWLTKADIVDDLDSKPPTTARTLAALVACGAIESRPVKGENGRPHLEYRVAL